MVKLPPSPLVKIESTVHVEAPPAVAFRFYCLLDHLRFVCTERRREWCHATGRVQTQGSQHEVRLRQGRHEIRLRFRTVRLQPDLVIEDEFLSWPLRGARRTLQFAPSGTGTRVTETNAWTPPRFVRTAVQNRTSEQQGLFDQKLDNGRKLIEAAFGLRGELAFTDGIFADAEALGVSPVVPLPDSPAP